MRGRAYDVPMPIETGSIHNNLRPAPINPDWVIDGNPSANNAELFRSDDGLSSTVLWECSPGRFIWIYDTEETIHILEGSIVLDDGINPARRYGAGDVVFFPAGAKVQWTVEQRVRKLAYFRRGLPKPLATVVSNLRRIKHVLRPVPKHAIAGI